MTNKFLIAGSALILIYLSPLLIFGQDSLVAIHDNLDYIHFKILSESGQIFGSNNTVIPNLMNGAPRSALGSEFSVQLWFYYFFGPFPGLVLNEIFIHVIAFVGMYRLLKRNFIPQENHLVIIGTAASFALLPFFSIIGLTGASQPLVLDAFLAMRKNGSKWIDWLIIVLMPLYTWVFHANAFFLVLMGVIFLYDLGFRKKLNLQFLAAIFVMGAMYLLVENRVLDSIFFDSNFVSHRTEFAPPPSQASFLYSLYQTILSVLRMFFWGHENAKSLHAPFILPATVIGLFILFDRGIKDKRIPRLILTLVAFCGLYGFFTFPAWPLKEYIPFLRIFRAERFFYLNPLLWYTVFALSLHLIVTHARKGNQIVGIFLCLQILLTFFYHDEIQMRNSKPTYREFFAEKLFKSIDTHIGRDKRDYRVVSIGMHPSIAQYNGFYTVDGYLGSYPVEHKHAFRKIIARELEKNPANRDYFDYFAGRCYVFVAELAHADWLYTKDRNVSINDLELNTRQLKVMGGEYIFSAVEIKNYKDNNLEFVKAFDDNSSGWKIYLYRPMIPIDREDNQLLQ